METLERYVTECENKRRRMRDRPSDAVISEMRLLLDFLKADQDEPPGRGVRKPFNTDARPSAVVR